ncbi:MAG: multiheme c-type cytochrome, partial [Thermodesulfobacteriota bacterium]
MRKSRRAAGGISLSFLFFLALSSGGAAISVQPHSRQEPEEFSEEYWVRPVPLQGTVPDGFTSLESSLYPKDCGACHQAQYADWSGSLHSMAVGPGLLGQLSPDENPDFAASCYLCHAPLSEQQEYLIVDGKYEKNNRFDEKLQKSGVSCGVCHVRGYRRFGPPPLKENKRGGGHGGFTASSFFEQSEFCAACHQFPEGAFALNGKLLENTYNEWRASPYPEKGVTCQGCHMPGRRHLFRGIHDPEMVKSGVEILLKERKRGVLLTIINSNTGHYFPTYVPPLIVVRGSLLDKSGNPVDGSVKKKFIGRRVELNLSREIEDTRIPPLGRFVFDYSPDDTG